MYEVYSSRGVFYGDGTLEECEAFLDFRNRIGDKTQFHIICSLTGEIMG